MNEYNIIIDFISRPTGEVPRRAPWNRTSSWGVCHQSRRNFDHQRQDRVGGLRWRIDDTTPHSQHTSAGTSLARLPHEPICRHFVLLISNHSWRKMGHTLHTWRSVSDRQCAEQSHPLKTRHVNLRGRGRCRMMSHDVAWCRMMSHDVAWCRMMSHDVAWCRMISHDVARCRMMSHDVAWRRMMSHDVTWCRMTSHDVAWRRITSHDVAWCCMMSYDVTWCRMTSHDVAWYHMTSFLSVQSTLVPILHLSRFAWRFVNNPHFPHSIPMGHVMRGWGWSHPVSTGKC